MGPSGTYSAGANKQRGGKGAQTAFQQTQPQFNQATAVRCSLTRPIPQSRTSPPPEVPAANVMNASVNNTHSPFHRTACSQPAIWGLNRPHTNLRIIRRPQKVNNYYGLRFPCAWLWGEQHLLPPMQKKKKKSVGRRVITRPRRDS